jgi:hypothetical protein
MGKLRLPVIHSGHFARRSWFGTLGHPYYSLVDFTGSRVSTPGLLSQPAAPDYRQFVAGRQQALSRSRATPVSTCPVHRPRWCPLTLTISHERTAAFRSLQGVGFPFPRKDGKLSLLTTTIHISGFNLTACTLAYRSSSTPFITETHVDLLRTCLAWALVRSDLSY